MAAALKPTGRIAFQGEPGAYSHQACHEARPDLEALPCRTFEDVIEAVRKGEADLAMLPVENSTYGRVADIHHLLPESGLHIINEAFQFLTDQPKVMIRVASDLEEPLSGKVNLMASRVGYEGQVVLTGDPELELTDCRISWYAGAVERSLDETWEQIDEMVSRVLKGLPAREHPEPKPVEDESESEGESENEADADTGKMEAQPPELTESIDSEALASASEAGEDIDHSAAVASGTEEEDEDGPAGEPSVPHEHTEPRPALATEE